MCKMSVALALVAVALSGCAKREEGVAGLGNSAARSRYVGVGIYGAGRMWEQLATPTPATPSDPAAARLKDDDHVIVVVDTATGELRQCGNLSGHCLVSNPWAKTTTVQSAPASVLKHLERLEEEDRQAAEAASSRR